MEIYAQHCAILMGHELDLKRPYQNKHDTLQYTTDRICLYCNKHFSAIELYFYSLWFQMLVLDVYHFNSNQP